nr:SLC13 family permease [uncultured Holophaga sp.]
MGRSGGLASHSRELGGILGIILCLIVWFMPAPHGLPWAGQKCLALSLLAVCWWACSVVHPGFTSLLLLVGWILTGTAAPEQVLALWTKPLLYIVVGGSLIAAAVEKSGLGRRIAYWFILRYVHSFRGILASAYFLGFLLSFVIPHPWPRSFMVMAIMAIVVRACELEPRDAANVGLAVFASSVPVSMILLTGDSAINPMALSFAGVEPRWITWLWYMGVPGIAATLLTFLLQLKLFPAPKGFVLRKEALRAEAARMPRMTRAEKATAFWVGAAVLLWATDSLHHISAGWVALLAAVGLALPRIGGVLEPADWNRVSLPTLFFLTAGLGIGAVGKATGMSGWLATVILPAHVPGNLFLFALLVTALSIAVHLCVGSIMAVMGIVTPTILVFTAGGGMNPVVPALLVYLAVGMHFILPFHHMNVLVGEGDLGGRYGRAEVFRLGLPLTLVVFVTILGVALPWWKLIGLIR